VNSGSVTARIRRCEESDVDAVAALRTICFPNVDPDFPSSKSTVTRVLALSDNELHSFVAEVNGKIVGFLGVIPRSWMMAGNPIKVAIWTHFMVHPEARGQGVGSRLLRQVMESPADMCFADHATTAARSAWMRATGICNLAYSMHWTLPLRPLTYVLNRKGGRSRKFGAVTRVMDRLLSRYAVPAAPAPPLIAKELSPELFLSSIGSLIAHYDPRPVYNLDSVRDAFNALEKKNHFGEFRRVALYRGEELIGWYMFYANRDVTRTVQFNAKDDNLGVVFAHMAREAFAFGSTAMEGTLLPTQLATLTSMQCVFRPGDWCCIHARDPKITLALYSGRAFLTPFDGEWTAVP
jgi:GNAT superfamily N-acetyltransferase